MDPNYSDIDDYQFPAMDWKEFYDDVKEPIPPNAPRALGTPVDVYIFFFLRQQTCRGQTDQKFS